MIKRRRGRDKRKRRRRLITGGLVAAGIVGLGLRVKHKLKTQQEPTNNKKPIVVKDPLAARGITNLTDSEALLIKKARRSQKLAKQRSEMNEMLAEASKNSTTKTKKGSSLKESGRNIKAYRLLEKQGLLTTKTSRNQNQARIKAEKKALRRIRDKGKKQGRFSVYDYINLAEFAKGRGKDRRKRKRRNKGLSATQGFLLGVGATGALGGAYLLGKRSASAKTSSFPVNPQSSPSTTSESPLPQSSSKPRRKTGTRSPQELAKRRAENSQKIAKRRSILSEEIARSANSIGRGRNLDQYLSKINDFRDDIRATKPGLGKRDKYGNVEIRGKLRKPKSVTTEARNNIYWYKQDIKRAGKSARQRQGYLSMHLGNIVEFRK